jgi:2-octaprenyl-6-methoxyphenol hydroxylase
MRASTDILVSGGGVAGLAATAAFGAAGYSVICVDPVAPVTTQDAPDADLRTTAFLQPSVRMLQAAGLWERLAPHAMPLQTMRIVDAGGDTPVPRVAHDFDAAISRTNPSAGTFRTGCCGANSFPA